MCIDVYSIITSRNSSIAECELCSPDVIIWMIELKNSSASCCINPPCGVLWEKIGILSRIEGTNIGIIPPADLKI